MCNFFLSLEIVNSKCTKCNHTTQERPLFHCWKDGLLEKDLLYLILLIIRHKGGLQRLTIWKLNHHAINFHNFFLFHMIGPLLKKNYISTYFTLKEQKDPLTTLQITCNIIINAMYTSPTRKVEVKRYLRNYTINWQGGYITCMEKNICNTFVFLTASYI